MDALETKQNLIEQTLRRYTEPPFVEDEIQTEVVFDRERDRYLLLEVGWENGLRIHHTVAHLEIVNGKIWIQLDRTQRGIANDLLDNGVQKDEIVLGFRSENLRKISDFAVA